MQRTPSPEPLSPLPQGVSRHRLEAIGLMFAAVTLFSGLDTAAKYLVTHEGIPVSEVAWVRFMGQFLLLLTLAPLLGIMSAKALFTTKRLRLQLVRSLLMVGTTVCNFAALRYLRLDQTITITFLAPLVVALLAGPLLGEWVGWRRFAAILVGFIGILVAVRPGVADVHPAVLISFSGMVIYALFMLLTRYMAHFDPPLVTLFYSMFAGAIGAAPLALSEWVTPQHLIAWVLLCSLGVLGGVGHYLFLHAYRLAPASVVTPFLYLQLITMVSFGYGVFGDVPDLMTLAGASIIVTSGVYLVHRERMTGRAPAAAAPAIDP